MTDALIVRCLETFDEVMVAVSGLVQAQVEVHGWSDEPLEPPPDFIVAMLEEDASKH